MKHYSKRRDLKKAIADSVAGSQALFTHLWTTVTSGVPVDAITEEIRFNFRKDSSKDVIHLTEISLKEATLLEHTYLYGYEFTDKASPDQERIFALALKAYPGTIQNLKYTTTDFARFIVEPLRLLGSTIRKMSCVIYPQSGSQLNKLMTQYVRNFGVPSNNFLEFEFLERTASKADIDKKAFDEQYRNTPESRRKKHWAILQKVVEDIRASGSFSISLHTPVRLRKFIKPYIIIPTRARKKIKGAIEGKHVLVLDDTGVSGMTLTHTINAIHNLAKPESVTVFTMLGRQDLDIGPIKNQSQVTHLR